MAKYLPKNGNIEAVQAKSAKEKGERFKTAKKVVTKVKRAKERDATAPPITKKELMEVDVSSFGYKWGMPQAADLMIDVRFLPNPYWDEELRYRTGLDQNVSAYVLDKKQTKMFMRAWFNLLDKTLPGYVAEGKLKLSIAVGCTGGQHRSVVVAEETAKHLREKGYFVSLMHRDIDKAKLIVDGQNKPVLDG